MLIKNKLKYVTKTNFKHGSNHYMPYYEGICTLKNFEKDFNNEKSDYIFSDKNIVKGYEDLSNNNLKCIDIISKSHKLFKTLQSNVYDVLVKDIPEIIYALSLYPGSELVLDINMIRASSDVEWKIINSVIDAFIDHGIKTHVVNMKEADVLYIDNFSVIFFPFESAINPNVLNDFFKKYIKKNIIPNKKVYVSVGNDEAETKLFEHLGFEIKNLSDFNNLKNIIKYFNTVKTLASVSGIGLLASSFMKNGGTIIEIIKETEAYSSAIKIDKKYIYDELETVNLVSEIKTFYHILAFWKKHLYIGYSILTEQIESILKNV